MKPFSSILTVGALLAFAGRVVAAPVPNDAPVEAKHTEIVWHTVYHTTFVAVTKTEWVDPPTTTPTTATTADEETATTTTTSPTTTSKTTRTTESTTEEEYTTTSTTSTTTTSSTTTTTSSTTAEEETSTTETPTPTQPKPDIKVELPTTTPTPEPEPTPTPTPEPEPTPTPTPEPKPKPKTSTDGGWEGDATYYDPGMGSCGYTNTKDDMIAAISYQVLDPLNPGNPNNNPLCGKKIRCTRDGKYETIITVVDRCPVCVKGDLDLSPAAYAALGGTIAEGRFRIQCSWVV